MAADGSTKKLNPESEATEKPITTLELDKPLKWVDGRAELLLPEGKGWSRPEVEWTIVTNAEGDWVGLWPEAETLPWVIQRHAIIKLRYHHYHRRHERVRVADVLGVENLRHNACCEDYWHLRCVVVPA